ncbi:MAG: hypothetical protein CM15mP12_5390 [Gammaproteobacteria bacterium]|nr:MAG: hypothetical protein CM15mP12_5390 [Gammaproteobacteria bacterium]
MTTDYDSTFTDHDMRKVVGYDMAKKKLQMKFTKKLAFLQRI